MFDMSAAMEGRAGARTVGSNKITCQVLPQWFTRNELMTRGGRGGRRVWLPRLWRKLRRLWGRGERGTRGKGESGELL